MHITIAAIGKMKSSEEARLTSSYLTKLPWRIEMREGDGGKFKSKTDETAWLVSQLKGVEKIIILDERGKDIKSTEFAKMMATQIDGGVKRMGFIIGGADGLDMEQLPNNISKICFGKQTWPHMLVRVMLAEQLYRAHTILTNHPYHRE